MLEFARKTENGREAGLALIWVLMVLAITSALSLAFLQKVSIGISTTGARSNSIQAQYLAEAAANHAMWRLLNQETFPAADDVYYMHSLGNGRYGYKVRRHTDTTFATVAVVGGVGDTVVHQSYVLYVMENWYHQAWKYRQKISISADATDTDLEDFPYMVNIDAANGLFMNAQLNGDDIVFTDSDGTTQLDHELEKYVSLDGIEELVAWVKLPSLSASETTGIYMYYGNHAASNQENAVDVWSNNDYESVYHLHDDFNDSVGNHDGIENTSSDVDGQIADAQDFSPGPEADDFDYIRIGTWDVGSQIENFTIQAWIKSDDGFAQDDPRVISKSDGSDEQEHVWMMSLYNGDNDENRLRFGLKTGTSNNSGTTTLPGSNPNGYLPDADQWYLVAMTYDGSQMRIIRDGLDAGSTGKIGKIRDNDWDIVIGTNCCAPTSTERSWDGKIDEVRISVVDRSIDWMLAEYRNQGSPPAVPPLLRNEENRYMTGTNIVVAHFESDDEGFVFSPGAFTDPDNSTYESGDYISSGGYKDSGALRVQLGGINDVDVTDGMSGGWQQTFYLAADSDVTVTFVYKLAMTSEYEYGEDSQVLVSVNGTLYGEGDGGDGYVAQINSKSDDPDPPISTGWHRFHLEKTLTAGTYTLIIGGHNNRKNDDDESTEIIIDDVFVRK